MTTESGRSMVEMLGVLAIIGVLSIGGIAGYTYAMNKSKANDILDGVSRRALVVSQQMILGNTASLVEYNNKKIGDYAVTLDTTQGDGFFGIQVSGVEQAVCERLQDQWLSNASDIYLGDDYLDEATCAEENNDITYVFNEALNGSAVAGGGDDDPACVGVTCADGLTCFHGECKCSDGTFMCGTECCAEGTYCTQGTSTSTYSCVAPTGDCASNSDCSTSDQYCKFSSGDCNGPTGGTCTDKGTLESNFTPYTVAGVEVYKSSSTINWWSAKNLCQAHGKQLVTMADLGISDQAGKTYCYFDHSKTTDATLQCICNGDEGCTQTTSELYTIGTSGYLWLADNSKTDSCRARFVGLGSGYVSNGGRSSRLNPPYVLCR